MRNTNGMIAASTANAASGLDTEARIVHLVTHGDPSSLWFPYRALVSASSSLPSTS
jgi:hypothetical protein